MSPSAARFLRRFSIILAIIGVSAAAWAAWTLLGPDSLAEARASYDRRDWDGAAARARRVLKERPGDREALRWLARSEARLGRDREAQELFGRLGPEAMQAEDFVCIAASLARQGRPGPARQALEMARDRDPDHAEALHDLARIDAGTGNLFEAIDLSERLATHPGWEARGALMLGLLRSQAGNATGAVEALNCALRLSPDLAGLSSSPESVRKVLAASLLQAGKPAEAVAVLRAVLARATDPGASWLLSRALLQEGDARSATDALAKSEHYGDRDPLAPEPAPYVGAATCLECHRAIHRTQRASRHARTFPKVEVSATFPLISNPLADPTERGVTHTLSRKDGKLQWETRHGDRVLTAVVKYLFGSGDIGVTPVAIDSAGQLRELRLSHYGGGAGWDITTGQPKRPNTDDDYLGRPLTRNAGRLCLDCHTTNSHAASEGSGPLVTERGIGCEGCHGPGGNHLRAIGSSFPDPAIGRPRLASTERVVALCATCHSPRDKFPSPGDPTAPRFASTALVWSRCYTESRGGMSCVVCHDPHRDAETSPAFYESKCVSCHAMTQGSLQTSSPPGRGAPCPVNPARDCLSCHMPKVPGIVPHVAFTDHFIRVRSKETNSGEHRAKP